LIDVLTIFLLTNSSLSFHLCFFLLLKLLFFSYFFPTASPVLTKPPTIKSFFERKSEFETTSSNNNNSKKLSSSSFSDTTASLKSPPIKPPRTSLIISRTSATDESDSESCVSSRISSPPVSPVAKKPLTRTLSSETNTSISSNSTLTSGSGSQASCSSNASTPDVRANKIVANNEIGTSRKSILASSKSRSGRECLEKSWRDEDSTDGGAENNDFERRMSKTKTKTSMINYKLVSAGDNIVDKVINVATYVEVISSDSDEKPEANSTLTVEKNDISTKMMVSSVKREAPQSNHILSDMAKWVRSEATKVNEPIVVKQETTEIRTSAKVLEPPKKLNLSELRKNFENKTTVTVTTTPTATATTVTTKSTKEKPISNHNRFSSWDSVGSSSSGVSSEMLGTGTGTTSINSESLQTDFGSFSSYGSSHSLITPQVSVENLFCKKIKFNSS
jgi:hypothetical protein